MDERYARCARLIARAQGLLVTAGAGIGVDSGLPDFRGSEGLWRAYPALQRAGLRFHDIACPDAFGADPRLAWGFYGHRLKRYRDTVPNAAFAILQAIAKRLPYGAFVFTSNVDGQFQRAGFDPDRICECHGSIHHLQCLARCGDAIWPAYGFLPEVDMAACRLSSPLPRCPVCHGVARPNILMFGDDGWVDVRTRAQDARLSAWLSAVDHLVVIEIGAGTAIPTVRLFGELQHSPLIRINPHDARTRTEGDVSLPVTGVEAMREIAAALGREGFLAAEPPGG
jgi:NAD-dependent SIR2 family protein deacetylase